MKSLLLALVAFAAITFFSGCSSEEGYYTPSQVAAQHSAYEPTDRLQSSRHY